MPLPCPELAGSGEVGIELFNGSTSFFSRVRHEAGIRPKKGDWFQHARLSDGSVYLEWSGLFEFLVSADGRQIACRELNGASPESFQTYLVGQVLSFALLKQGGRASSRDLRTDRWGSGGFSWRLWLWQI